MTSDKQERIRQKAHAIWEKEGRPHGVHEKHWHQATKDVDDEDAKPGATGDVTAASAARPGKAAAKRSKEAAEPKAKEAAKPKARRAAAKPTA